uniref:Chorion peroxidase n=1 Tax=Strigamia maritima TaxID=126957 RepID=T1J8N9_STRMM
MISILYLLIISMDSIASAGLCTTNMGDAGVCVESYQCQKRNGLAYPFRSFCILKSNQVGHCCPINNILINRTTTEGPIVVRIGTAYPSSSTVTNPFTTQRTSLFSPRPSIIAHTTHPAFSSSRAPLSAGAVRVFGERAMAQVRDMEVLENILLARGIVIKEGSTEALHQASLPSDEESLKLAKKALANDKATKEIATQLSILTGRSADELARVSVHNTNLNDSCQFVPVCRNRYYKYRSTDGSCNNLLRRQWGTTFTAFDRLLPPVYGDGVSSPRLSSSGHPLPSTRVVSTAIASDAYHPDLNHTLLLMQWGQFVDHDLQLTPIFTVKDGTGISCCHPDVKTNSHLKHPECLEITVPHNDSFFGQFQHTCMEFVRSLPALRSHCNLGTREQMNRVTSYLDASTIYGTSESEIRKLRTFNRGMLKAKPCNGNDYLPFKNDGACHARHQFLAGDSRANQHLHLTALHTLWLREHNRIAQELSNLNFGWSDEILFQEARRIVVAQIQHITYNEFLPILLGIHLMHLNDLLPLEDGFSFNYDSHVNPSILNEFSTAAFRFGHSLIQGIIHLSANSAEGDQLMPFRDQFLTSYQIHNNGFLEKTLRSLLLQSSQKMDKHFSYEITRHLFERRNSFGLDLVALDLQRGRDHGLPGYNQFRRHCGLVSARYFDDFRSEIDEDVIKSFKQVYSHVDDVDLFIAAIAERPLPGALLGPTFACIIAEQFIRLKKGDRFWYENGLQVSSFSESQLSQLRKSTLARVICDNSDLRRVQAQGFFKEAPWNPSIPCDSKQIPRVYLNAWKNEPVLSRRNSNK